MCYCVWFFCKPSPVVFMWTALRTLITGVLQVLVGSGSGLCGSTRGETKKEFSSLGTVAFFLVNQNLEVLLLFHQDPPGVRGEVSGSSTDHRTASSCSPVFHFRRRTRSPPVFL